MNIENAPASEIDRIRDWLKDQSLHDLEQIAPRIGVSTQALLKIRYGKTLNPRLKTVMGIYRLMAGQRVA